MIFIGGLLAVNGTKWMDWMVLPGQVFAHPENYPSFKDHVNLNAITYEDTTGQSYQAYSVSITLPERASCDSMYYQICVGSYLDPYRLAFNYVHEVNADEERVLRIPQMGSQWEFGFIYIVYFWSINNVKTIVPIEQCPLYPWVNYIECNQDCDLRMGNITPQFHPGLFYYNISEGTISSTSEGSNIKVEYFGQRVVQNVRINVSYQHHNGNCPPILNEAVKDSVSEHFTLYNVCPITIPVNACLTGPQTGTFTYEVVPSWEPPSITEDCYVEPNNEFPYYGEEGSDNNTISFSREWTPHQYIPDYKYPALIVNGGNEFDNSMNDLEVIGDDTIYLPANQQCYTNYSIYNNSLVPAYNISYQFDIKKRNLSPYNHDTENNILEWVDFEYGDSQISIPINNRIVIRGNLTAMDTMRVALMIRHNRTAEDYKRIWSSDSSEWLINLSIGYDCISPSGNEMNHCEVYLTGNRIIFLEDERNANYGFPLDRVSDINQIVSGSNGSINNFIEYFYSDDDNAYCSSYGQLFGMENRKLHTGVDIPTGNLSTDANKLAFSVARGKVLYDEESVSIDNEIDSCRNIKYNNVQYYNLWGDHYVQYPEESVYNYTLYLKSVFHDTYRNSGIPLAITQYIGGYKSRNGHLHFEEIKQDGKTINPLRRGGLGNGNDILANDYTSPLVVKNGIKLLNSSTGIELATSYDPAVQSEIPSNLIDIETNPKLSIIAEIRDLLINSDTYQHQNGIYEIDFFIDRLVPDQNWERFWPKNNNNNQITSVNFYDNLNPAWHSSIHPFGANKENLFNICIDCNRPDPNGFPKRIYLDKTIFSRNGQYMLVVNAYDIHAEHYPNTNNSSSWWLPFQITGSGQQVDPYISENQCYSGDVYIDSDVVISDGATLSFQPGTSIIVAPGCKIILDKGQLQALGTSEDVITFRTCSDSIFWGGIRCNADSTSIELAYTNIMNSENIDGLGQDLGGALYVGYTDYAKISDCQFENCHSMNGGAIYVNSENVTIENVKFVNNHAVSGGAVFVDTCSINVVGSYFTRNCASDRGSALYMSNSNTGIINCTIVNNKTSHDGCVILVDNSDAMIANSIVWNNLYSSNSHQIFIQNDSQPSFINCNIEYGISTIAGEIYEGIFSGNISIDPNMVPDQDYAYILSPNSPCINAGSLSGLIPEVLPVYDIVGSNRIDTYSLFVDIGAYEYSPNEDVVYWTQDICSDTDWDMDIVYLEDSITVQDSASLVIFPGTKVVLGDNAVLNVNGLIKSLGTEDNHVVFTIPDSVSVSGKIQLRMTCATGLNKRLNSEVRKKVAITSDEDEKYSMRDSFLFTDFLADPSYATNDSLFGIKVELYDNNEALFRNCKFSGSIGGDYGGSLFMHQSSPQLVNCSFVNNKGYQGGAIYALLSFPYIKSCIFDGNGSSLGGAVYTEESYCDLINCILDGNNAEDGGALYFKASSINHINNTIINNTASRGGGAVICNGSDLLALNSIVYDNEADVGEQVFVDNGNEDGTILFEYCNIEGGISGFAYADSIGYKAKNSSLSRHYINRTSKKKSEQKNGDDDIHNNIDQDPLLDIDYSISFISPCLDSGCDEGYLFNYHQINEEYLGYKPTGYSYDIGARELDHVPLLELSGIIGSNAFIFADSVRIIGDLTILDSVTVVIDSMTTCIEIAGNYSINVMGTLCVSGSQNGNIDIAPISSISNWKGFTVSSNGILDLKYCTVCKVENDSTGAIAASDNAKIDIKNCIIEYNTSILGKGGAVCMSDNSAGCISQLFIEDSVINNNQAVSGGALYVGCGSNARIVGSKLYLNSANEGGALVVRDSTFILNSELFDNTSQESGGGVYYEGNSMFMLNCVVTQNTCGIKGGGICFEPDPAYNEKTVVLNSIIWNNTCLADSTYNIYGLNPTTNGSRQYYNCRIGDFGDCRYSLSSSVLDDDPMFVDQSSNDFRLRYYSSCIDGGITLPYYLDSFQYILRPMIFDRIMSGDNYDIGSIEFMQEQVCEISPSILRYGNVAIGDTLSVMLQVSNHSNIGSFEISSISLPTGFTLGYEESKGNESCYVPVGTNKQDVHQNLQSIQEKSYKHFKTINNTCGNYPSITTVCHSNNQSKELDFPIIVPALGYIQLPIVFEPLFEDDYSGTIVINNSANSVPAEIYISAMGYDDTQYVAENTDWADTVLINTNITIKPGYTLNVGENTNVVFMKNRKLTIDHATLSIADSVHFKSAYYFKDAGIYLKSSNETEFDHITMSKCRIVSDNTPLIISNSIVDTTQISQKNHDIQILSSNLYYSNVTMSVIGLFVRKCSASIIGNKFFFSPYRHLISINSYPEFEITDNYLYNYQTAIWLNESGHGDTNRIKNNTIKYNQYGYGIEIYHSNAEIYGCNEISSNYIGVAGMRNSIITLEGYEEQPYQSIHDNIDSEIVFAADSFPPTMKCNLVFDQIYGQEYLFKLVHYNGTNQLSIEDNYWGDTFDPQTDLYPYELLSFEPIWEIGTTIEELFDPIDELYHTAMYNMEIGNYLLSYDQFAIVAESADDESPYKKPAMEILITLADLIDQPYSELQQYYLNEPSYHYNNSIEQLAAYLANYCSIKMGDYPAAIEWFENILDDPPTEADSIYAFIDLAYTYVLMESSERYKGYVGRYPQCRFDRYEDYIEARETLVRKLLANQTSQNDHNPSIITTLEQNFPNPFNPSTTIKYSLEKDTDCSIEIFNIRGQKVRSLVNGFQAKGPKSLVWNGRDAQGRNVASGVYFYKLTTPYKSIAKKMLLLK